MLCRKLGIGDRQSSLCCLLFQVTSQLRNATVRATLRHELSSLWELESLGVHETHERSMVSAQHGPVCFFSIYFPLQ